jgi:3-oxoacyl-[acyl-carrier protein] reductase
MRMLEERVAVVTGGSRGIGRAIALKLAEAGAKVLVNYGSDTAAADSLAAQAAANGWSLTTSRGSVADGEYVKALFKEARGAHGRIDILVNNAGIKRDGLLMMMPSKDWDDVIDVNLKGVYLCTRGALRPMVSQRSGRIINITSVSGVVGQPGQTNYAASKGGLIGFTKALAKEVARFGIAVNAVAPGFIETDMIKDMPPEALEASRGGIPFQRLGRPEEVADAALFLASAMATYVTGQVLHVDGGLAM